MTYRVIQWGTGSVGQAALSEILTQTLFELVGVKVYDERKVGLDAARLCGPQCTDLPATGILAVRETDALPLQDADCVIYCPMIADYDEIARLLEAGVNVITTASNPVGNGFRRSSRAQRNPHPNTIRAGRRQGLRRAKGRPRRRATLRPTMY